MLLPHPVLLQSSLIWNFFQILLSCLESGFVLQPLTTPVFITFRLFVMPLDGTML